MASSSASNVDPGDDLSIQGLFGVRGKVALVTGGGTGIGRMIAAGLAQNGAKVYIASRKMEVVQKTADEINAQGYPGTCIALQADLSDRKSCEKLADEVKKRETVLNILVNNSGISWGGPLLDFDEKNGWDKLMAVNVKALWYLTVALLPLLSKSSGGNVFNPGRVINVSSVGSVAVIGQEGSNLAREGNAQYSYMVSKAAVNHLTRNMAPALAKHNVTVNAIAPGFFVSRMTAYGYEHNKSDLESRQPTGRVGGTEDMAGLVLYLCSRASAHLTGDVIAIDGGARLAGGTKLPMDFPKKIAENRARL
ncbi:hypothetical protein DFJ74DRAFT_652446 [Hyaloraphidium curvatum]|nr:hypothetical protein DFJ74DRAFT_652446 [Hyaloraphidium curvatum]